MKALEDLAQSIVDNGIADSWDELRLVFRKAGQVHVEHGPLYQSGSRTLLEVSHESPVGMWAAGEWSGRVEFKRVARVMDPHAPLSTLFEADMVHTELERVRLTER